ncbi:MAG: hypothetical protein GYA14_09370 [Ignavibacteria bacterium]|nr:hypothetical protein [Ignavibacteria bacterium]
MKAYIPNNLNLGAEKHRDKYYYIIRLIYYGRIFDKRNIKHSFISLNGQFLHKVLGGNYIKYLRWLIDSGIIESDKHYEPNKKSIGYRLTEKYRNEKFRKVEITNKRLIEKIEKLKVQHEQSISNPTLIYLIKCLKSIKLDFDGANNWLVQNISEINNYEYSNATSSIDLLYSNDSHFTVSSLTGRFYSTVTNLKKELRPFLKYNGQSLVEVDIANSQPFFLNFLLIDYYSNNNSLIKSYSDIKYISYDTKNNLPDDSKKYIDLTSKGVFYEYLMEAFNYSGDRDKFKKMLFARVYYNDTLKGGREEWFLFQDLFPSVAEVITHHKKENYKNLAIMLQIAESDMMIYKIVPKLIEKIIYALTIHDSYLVIENDSAEVKKIILNEFKNLYGLIPFVRIKGGK